MSVKPFCLELSHSARVASARSFRQKGEFFILLLAQRLLTLQCYKYSTDEIFIVDNRLRCQTNSQILGVRLTLRPIHKAR